MLSFWIFSTFGTSFSFTSTGKPIQESFLLVRLTKLKIMCGPKFQWFLSELHFERNDLFWGCPRMKFVFRKSSIRATSYHCGSSLNSFTSLSWTLRRCHEAHFYLRSLFPLSALAATPGGDLPGGFLDLYFRHFTWMKRLDVPCWTQNIFTCLFEKTTKYQCFAGLLGRTTANSSQPGRNNKYIKWQWRFLKVDFSTP